MPLELADLSQDVLFTIFTKLDPKSLKNALQVNRTMYSIGSLPVLWKDKLLPEYANQEKLNMIFAKNQMARLPNYRTLSPAVCDALSKNQYTPEQIEILTHPRINDYISANMLTIDEALSLKKANLLKFLVLTEKNYSNVQKQILTGRRTISDIWNTNIREIDLLETSLKRANNTELESNTQKRRRS